MFWCVTNTVNLTGVFFRIFFCMYFIQHCFICRPSDSTVPEDAGIEPRTVATSASAVRRSSHPATSHPHSATSHPVNLYSAVQSPCRTAEVGQCRTVQDTAGQYRTVQDSAGHWLTVDNREWQWGTVEYCIRQCRTVQAYELCMANAGIKGTVA